jgi:aspartate aminotransferase
MRLDDRLAERFPLARIDPHPSSRLELLPASAFRKLVPLIVAAEKEGVLVHKLNIGSPDIKAPEEMLSLLNEFQMNPIGYTLSEGEPSFLDAFRIYIHRLGFTFIKNSDLLATAGASEGIKMAVFAVCEPGDELLTFEPFYQDYDTSSRLAGVNLITIPTSIKNSFHLPDRKEIESKITPRTKAIIFSNPNNPTGAVYTKDEIKLLVDIARHHHLFLISDEVYREFCYDGREHHSLLNYFEAYPERMILLDSMSKRYSLCGIRVGIIASMNQELMGGFSRMAQARLCVGVVDQLIAARLSSVPQSYFDGVIAEYKARRDLIYHGLKTIPGIEIHLPEGAFYTMVTLPVENAHRFARWLLTHFRYKGETVALAPAEQLYLVSQEGKRQVRIAYVLNQDRLARAVEVLRRALQEYPS